MNGWFATDQFRTPADMPVHEETTAAELLEQSGGKIGAFGSYAVEGIGGSEAPANLHRDVIDGA